MAPFTLKTQSNPVNIFGEIWNQILVLKFVFIDIFFALLLKNYEVRKYPVAKWACTKEYDVDPMTDPMRNWETKV